MKNDRVNNKKGDVQLSMEVLSDKASTPFDGLTQDEVEEFREAFVIRIHLGIV